MPSLTLQSMRAFLARSITSLNQNKIRGLLAEVELRQYLRTLGLDDRVSPGGWIARKEGPGEFGHQTVVMFPEIIEPGDDYPNDRIPPNPSHGLHTICATFHQSGINAYYCAATVPAANDGVAAQWRAVQLGLPTQQPYQDFPACLAHAFRVRERKYTFLRYNTDASLIPDDEVPAEFSKESLRIAFQTRFMAEISDVDGIFWGQQFTYPLEIKEKTAASSRGLGEFFGLDVGPFVKLAFFAAKRGNLHSLFIVREVDPDRQLLSWWFMTFEQLAQFASWVQQGGGKSMLGGMSSVVRIPKAEFRQLTAQNLAEL